MTFEDFKKLAIFTIDFEVRECPIGNLKRLGTLFREIQQTDKVLEMGIIQRPKIV